jgi:hypothetical protein
MCLSHDFPCRLVRLLFAITMGLIWAGGADPVRAQQAGATAAAPADVTQTAEARAAAAEQFDRSVNAIADAARQAPRDRFDVQWVVNHVGADPVKLFEWVRDQTAWVPYRGVLRGEAGVLMDRLGNSLDRALLLAALLKASGQPVRLAHGTIAAAETPALLSKIRTVPQLNASLVSTAAGGSSAPAPTTSRSAGDPLDEAAQIRRLMVAQDTGGAIRGPVRADVFWGHGPDAELRAGRMRSPGRYYLLIPKSVTPTA